MTLALGALLLVGCPAKKEAIPGKPAERPLVIASIPPLAHLLDQLRWDQLDVAVLLPEGKSPLLTDARAGLPAAASRAKIFFGLGLPFEAPLVQQLKAVAGDLEEVETSDSVGRMPGQGGAAKDPHVWLDPTLARVLAKNMAEALIDLDGDKEKEVEANLAGLLADLATLDLEVKGILEPVKGATLHVAHPAYGYFCKRYGLKQVSTGSGSEALQRLVKEAAAAGARGIYVQSFALSRALRSAAAGLKLRVITLDPLARDYSSGMRDLATILRESATPPPRQ